MKPKPRIWSPWNELSLKGSGRYDTATTVETPRVEVTLATALSPGRCARINLGHADASTLDLNDWPTEPGHDTLLVPRAGEVLYRVGRPAD